MDLSSIKDTNTTNSSHDTIIDCYTTSAFLLEVLHRVVLFVLSIGHQYQVTSRARTQFRTTKSTIPARKTKEERMKQHSFTLVDFGLKYAE